MKLISVHRNIQVIYSFSVSLFRKRIKVPCTLYQQVCNYYERLIDIRVFPALFSFSKLLVICLFLCLIPLFVHFIYNGSCTYVTVLNVLI